MNCVTRKLQNFAQNLEKCQNINIKAKFESPKQLHQTTFETLKYLQQTMCGNWLFR